MQHPSDITEQNHFTKQDSGIAEMPGANEHSLNTGATSEPPTMPGTHSEPAITRSMRKKLLRSQIKEINNAENRKNMRNKKLRRYITALIILMALPGLFYLKSISALDSQVAQGPIIEINPQSYNFGPVSQARGVVTAEMAITNKGNSTLILNNLDTSCGCTSVSIIYNGVESPKFSMAIHGTNPGGWSLALPPGESALLKVYYDPNVHKTLRGAATRSVFIFSNDPRNSKEEVRISLVQVD